MENVDYSNACIGVVGLGYVGLPTALAFHSAGFRVIGIDYSKSVIDALKSGKSHLNAERPNFSMILQELTAGF